jgi:hypothetical protein
LFTRAGDRLRCRSRSSRCIRTIERRRCHHAADAEQSLQNLSPIAGSRQRARKRVEASIVHDLPFFESLALIVADLFLTRNVFPADRGRICVGVVRLLMSVLVVDRAMGAGWRPAEEWSVLSRPHF